MPSVPYEPYVRAKWIEAIETYQEFDYTPTRFHLCENHFQPNDIQRFGTRTTLKPGTIPSIFPFIVLSPEKDAKK